MIDDLVADLARRKLHGAFAKTHYTIDEIRNEISELNLAEYGCD